MNNFLQGYRAAYGLGLPMGGSGILILILIWSFFWKGLGLWHSSQRKQGRWFVLLLLVNTLGILEIIYLFLVAKIPTSELFETKKNNFAPKKETSLANGVEPWLRGTFW